MLGKIGLEEHFALEKTVEDSRLGVKDSFWPAFRERLLDFHKIRIEEMDKQGIEMMILSFNAPAVQAVLDVEKAIELAKYANDTLAEQIAKNPKRFAGFAALPMQDPDAAAAELHRCVKDYGFKGAFVNGFTQLHIEDSCYYYDLPQYWPFWAEVQKLDVPFYLHPRPPLKSQRRIYEGHEWLLNSPWGFSVETGTHALRLMGSGLFDEYPNLNIIVGHMGELLPANIWRTDHRLNYVPQETRFKRPFSEYLSKNFYVTTSGNYRMAPLLAAIMEMGSDRIMFATEWPFGVLNEAATWLDSVDISETERLKIGRLNAVKLFKLDL